MHIYVTTLTGKTSTFIVESTDTLASVKERYADLQGIPPTSQRMVFAGKELDDDSRTLAEWSIGSESTIHLVLSLRSKPMKSDP